MSKDIDVFFPSFLESLKISRDQLSFLLLTGKLEDYFLRLFLLHIHSKMEHRITAYANLGSRKKKEGRIDLCIFDNNNVIFSIIEGKHIENVRRDFDVGGEITSPLRELDRQVYHISNGEKIYGNKVKLKSENKSVYALIFCTFKGDKNAGNYSSKKEIFFRDILKNKFTKKFKSIGKSEAELESAFEDHQIKFGVEKYVTLRVGLWVKKNRGE
jgi:hypothetical protein